MSFQPDDDTRHNLTAAHNKAAAFLSLVCTGPPVFGTSGTTIGRRAGNVWLRVSRSSRHRAPRPAGQGALGAEQLVPASVPRPRLHDTVDWTGAGWFYQADVFDLVGPAVSSTPDLRRDPRLDDGWWTALRDALAGIAEASSEKITLRQTWVEEVFPKYLGIPAPAEIERTTGHGDLQWANLTAAPLKILDWERWGLVPVGYDPAVLWVSSLLVPAVAHRIREEFSGVLDSPAGRVGGLIALAEMLQAADRGYYPELAPLLADRARELTGTALPQDIGPNLNTSDLAVPGASDLGRRVARRCLVVRRDGDRFGRIAGGPRPECVVGSFDAEVRHFAFDDAGVGASAAGGQQVAGYLAQALGEGGGQAVRGKRPPARRPGGARGGGCG